MRMSYRAILLLILGTFEATAVTMGAVLQTAGPVDVARVSPLTSEQLIQILDETVDWYRTLGTQQQSATQPSDLLLFYADRQTADKVIRLAFEIARANAELLSSEVSSAGASGAALRSPQDLQQLEQKTVQRGE